MVNDRKPSKEFFDRIFDPEHLARAFAEYFKPIVLPKASGEWIPAGLARQFVCEALNVDQVTASDALCRRALTKIRVSCEAFSRMEEPKDYVPSYEFFDGHEPDFTHFSDEVSKPSFQEIYKFFYILGQYQSIPDNSEIELACWETGDFNIMLEMDFSFVTLQIIGLKFDKVALLTAFDSHADKALIDKFSPNSAKPQKTSRNSKYDWVGAIAHLVGIAELDSLVEDPHAHGALAKVEKAIADWFAAKTGDQPSEAAIRPYANKVLASIKEADQKDN